MSKDHLYQDLPEWTMRTRQLLGDDRCMALKNAHVLVAGMGGVGAAATENLVRTGIGRLTIVDNDKVQASNINRQIPALHSTIGRSKIDVIAERLLDINPSLELIKRELYINDETKTELFQAQYDFVVDAIDTLSPKIFLIEEVLKRGIPLASSMGSGGKTDPTKITITDFEKTYNCRLAFVLRKKLRKLDIHGGFRVVFSPEKINKDLIIKTEEEQNKKSITGTVSYIPMIFGAMLASIVINDL